MYELLANVESGEEYAKTQSARNRQVPISRPLYYMRAIAMLMGQHSFCSIYIY